MADFFGVSEKTVNAWKKAHPEFLQSTTRGKMMADAEVADRLYQRALGYSHPAVKIMQFEGAPVVVPYTEHYPPDTPAASLWLRNRQPWKWRDRTQHEIMGENGGPIESISTVTNDPIEAAKIYAKLMNL
ncbi:terminase [Paraburkholderia sp. MM5477-R1]|uniref:terminase n=1 Tax=Paraburkholderia sp. MM5477-R1 TaxID=2991062 RepID=UPI003D1D9443